MLVLSYWLKTVLFWNGVQGSLQKGCLETTIHYNSMPQWGGPRLQPIKPLGKYGTVVNTEATLTVRCYIFLLNIDFLGNESYSYIFWMKQVPVGSWYIYKRSLASCVCFVDRCLSFCTFSFCPLCCLFFFNIRILITPLVSSNSS